MHTCDVLMTAISEVLFVMFDCSQLEKVMEDEPSEEDDPIPEWTTSQK